MCKTTDLDINVIKTKLSEQKLHREWELISAFKMQRPQYSHTDWIMQCDIDK